MIRPLPAIARLLEAFHYDPITGTVTRLVDVGRGRAGSVVASYDPKGYLRVGIDGHRYKGHRIIWKMVTGDEPPQIDHRDLDRANNRWANLRIATDSQNRQNSLLRRDNSSGYKRVSFDKRRGKWIAFISVNKRQIFLGYYADPGVAHAAYCAAAVIHFGEFARAA